MELKSINRMFLFSFISSTYIRSLYLPISICNPLGSCIEIKIRRGRHYTGKIYLGIIGTIKL